MKIKQTHLQDLKVAICSILLLVLLFLTAMELLTQEKAELTVKEPITVSSAITDTASRTYENILKGRLLNESTKTITVDSVTVTVKNRDGSKEIKLDQSFLLPAHAEQEISASTLEPTAYTDVESVTARVNGTVCSLSNAPRRTVGGVALILIALLLVAGYVLYRTILTRYYMYMEAKLTKSTEEQ